MDLCAVVEQECTRFGVPGAAVTVVAAGEVVLTRGFGVRKGADPVTPTTLFMLASDTKCLAAATLCLLVEDGLLDLDQPVRDHLPWFAMHDERISGWVTTRDLLAHRTGLPRHDFLTIGDGSWSISNEDIARRLRYLEGSRPFRQGFGYNNAHYATAGHVGEVLTGQPWRELLAHRVLAPLGMSGTSTYVPAQTAGDFAAPHVHGRPVPHQSRPYDLPSGGVVTHATDLGRWLLARLGQGALSAQVLDLLHAPAAVSGPLLPFPELHSMGYALGNMVFSYRGHRLHCHGGNQIGFASQVIVLPEAQVGVAVLTNEHASQLPLALGLALVDRVMGLSPVPWGDRLSARSPAASAPEAPAAPLPRPLSDYRGTFQHPAYGDLLFEVSDGGLRASFHGLDDQLLLSHRRGDGWDLGFATVPGVTVPVCFRRGSDGTVVDVTARFDAELPPLVFVKSTRPWVETP